ncbi:MAG: hypothetical protein KG003_06710 [Bacteroidetes bacterium]|nr:hypothetical protein [Bacteroidota bacterium]
MKWIIPITVLFVVSCKLIKPPVVISDPGGNPKYFNIQNHPELHQTLAAEYMVTKADGESELSIYPLSENGYEFDFVQPGVKGYAKMDQWAMDSARIYDNQYPDSSVFHHMSSIWLSKVNFEELRNTGKTKMAFRYDSLVEFHVKGITAQKIILQDTAYVIQAVEVVSQNPLYYFSFVPDAGYPLILKQDWVDKMELFSVQNRAPVYNDFTPGAGCVIHYNILEHFTEEYNVKLSNTEWSDSVVRFRMFGNFRGSEMNYNFDYHVKFRGSALQKPKFAMPVFSAIKGEKMEDTFNWIWLRGNEIQDIIQGKSNFLSIPHFAEYPGNPGDYEDTASYSEAVIAYNNSGKTKFEYQKYGRFYSTNYMFYGEDANDEQFLPSWRFYSPEERITIEVLANYRYPILLFYGDENVDINLVYARRNGE